MTHEASNGAVYLARAGHATHERHAGNRAVCGLRCDGYTATRIAPAELCKRCQARRASWTKEAERMRKS